MKTIQELIKEQLETNKKLITQGENKIVIRNNNYCLMKQIVLQPKVIEIISRINTGTSILIQIHGNVYQTLSDSRMVNKVKEVIGQLRLDVNIKTNINRTSGTTDVLVICKKQNIDQDFNKIVDALKQNATFGKVLSK